MKIETISVLQRKNLGNYEHIEISASAKIEDNESPADAIKKLKTYVGNALNGVEETVQEPIKGELANPVKEEAEVAPAKKEKKTRAKKEKPVVAPVEEVVAAPVVKEQVPAEVITSDPLAVEEAPVAVVYNSTISEHKSIFAGYLAEKYGNAWKTASTPDKIKEFTTSLNGKPFLTNDGKILASFISQVHGFFGA